MPGPIHSQSAIQPARRAFFKSALLGGGIAAAAIVASPGAHSSQSASSQNAPKTRGRGYRETPAIRQYYQLARQI